MCVQRDLWNGEWWTISVFVFVFGGFACTQDVRALGFFELQILEIENYRGQLATGECCGSGGGALSGQQQQSPSAAAGRSNTPPLHCAGAPQCNTLFQVCLREYQSRQQQQPQQQPTAGAAATLTGGGKTGGGDDDTTQIHQPNAHLHHCSFGNVTSPVLGGNSFTLGGDAATSDASLDNSNRGAAGGNLALPFSFSWTVSTRFHLYNIVLCCRSERYCLYLSAPLFLCTHWYTLTHTPIIFGQYVILVNISTIHSHCYLFRRL